MNRRTFLKGAFTIGGLGLITGLYTWRIEPTWLEFVHLKMPIKNLPDDLIGKTLIQISDLHIGDTVEADFLITSMQKAQALQPHFVVYTGDFSNYKHEGQLEQLAHVMQHAAKGSLATVGVLGNHDYGKKWAQAKVANQVISILTACNITILRNEQQSFNGLNIIGIDDKWSINYHPEQVMQQYDSSLANLVLCHNPDACDDPIWNGYDGWILSGHTHGGQVKPPFLPPPMLPVQNKRYSAGQINLEDGRTLYINRALGNLHHIRFNVRPEITVFELIKA